MNQSELDNQDLNFKFTNLHMDCISMFVFFLLSHCYKVFLKQYDQIATCMLIGQPSIDVYYQGKIIGEIVALR